MPWRQGPTSHGLTPSLVSQNRKVMVYLYRGLQEYEHLKPVMKLSRLRIILAIDSVFKADGLHTQKPLPQHTLETSLLRKPETLCNSPLRIILYC